jgi:3'(2'), 5'-bisphosphate nucleotidase
VDDNELALALASEASRLLIDLRAGAARAGIPAYDRCAALLLDGLRTQRPQDGVLYAGMAGDPPREDRHRVWIVDPLYGAAAYATPRETDFFVHVALWDSDAMVTGAIGLPARGLVIGCAPGRPSRRDRSRATIDAIGVGSPGSSVIADQVARSFGARLVPFRSHGASAAGVLLGAVDAHIVQQPESEWCSAAAVAVATANGMHASRLDGSRLRYNQLEPMIRDLLICPAHAGPTVVARIQAVRGSDPATGPA